METDLGVLGIEIQSIGFDQVMDNFDRISAATKDLRKEFRSLKLNNAASKSDGGLYASVFKGAKSQLGELAGLGNSVASNLSDVLGSAFDQFVFGGEQAKTVLKSLEDDLLGLGNSYFTGKKSPGTGDILSSMAGGAGSFLTNLFPGFASGGQFTVGGAAGRDRNLVGLRLSRGERVNIETPAQQKVGSNPSQSQTINMNFQINTPDAEGFRRSQSQIQSEALMSAQRLLKRNG